MPSPVVSPTYGALVSPWQVEQAVIGTLRAWVPQYIAQVEDQHGLDRGTLPRPPAAECFYGGADFDSWAEDLMPAFVVVVAVDESAERAHSAGYGQSYAVGIGAWAWGEDEDTTRMRAGLLATAAAGAFLQNVSEPIVHARMVRAPRFELPDPDRRVLGRGIVETSVFVQPVLDEKLGPVGLPQSDPDTGPLPIATINTVNVSVDAEPISDSE